MVAAVLEEKAKVTRQTWRAEQLLRDFQGEFTRRGYLFSSRDAMAFSTLIRERYAADYGNERFGQRRAAAALALSEKLCSRLEEVIENA
jgi:hypothetical protein